MEQTTAQSMDTAAGHSTTRLVAVVVTYNRLDQLRITLARLLASAGRVLQAVVVIDNASSDGTADWLATQRDPRLNVTRTALNEGGAGGFARGLARARDLYDPDWIVVMDDDARPEPGTLSSFHAHPPQADAVAAAVYHPDGRICDMNRPWVNPFWHKDAFFDTVRRGREGFHLGQADYARDTPRAIDGGSFVGLFLSRRALDLGGLPDPALFLYGDDVLYTLQLSRAGARVVFDPNLRFSHDFSTLGADQKFDPLWKAYYYHRNLLMIYRVAAGPWFWAVLPLILGKWRIKARHYEDGRQAYLRVLRQAVRDGLAQRTTLGHGDVLALASAT